jgi:hypothetical protein
MPMGRNRDVRGRFTSGDGVAGKAGEAASAIAALGMSSDTFGKKFGEAARGATDGLGRIAEAAVHVATKLTEIGVAGGLALAVHGVASLNNELEQTQISLGAVFNAQGYYSTFEDGFKRATGEVAAMRKEVMKLPGTFNELAEIMTTIASPASQTGMNIDQMRKLAEQTMLTAAVLKVPQDMAAREMAMLLSGRAGAHNVLGTRLGLVGGEAKKFNEEDPSKRFADLETRLNRYSGAADRFALSFKANETTLKDNALFFEQLATKPLFDAVNRSLATANTWIDSHREKLSVIADLVGNRIAGYWDRAEAAFVRIEPVVERIAHHVMSMTSQDVEGSLKKAGEIGLAMKLAPSMLGVAGKGLGSLAESGMGALAGAGAAASSAALAVLAVAAIGAAGAADVLTDSTNKYHREATEAAQAIETDSKTAWEDLKEDVQPALNAMHEFGDFLGLGFTQDVGYAVKAWNWLRDQLRGNDADSIEARQTELARRAHPFQYSSDRPEDRAYLPSDHGLGSIAGVGLARIGEGGNNAFWDAAGKAAVKELKPKLAPVTHIGQVNITVKGADDPSRVARLTMEHIERIARNPKQSPFVPDYTQPR